MKEKRRFWKYKINTYYYIKWYYYHKWW